jgi:hypothetical protein
MVESGVNIRRGVSDVNHPPRHTGVTAAVDGISATCEYSYNVMLIRAIFVSNITAYV